MQRCRDRWHGCATPICHASRPWHWAKLRRSCRQWKPSEANTVEPPQISLITVTEPDQLPHIRALFEEYAQQLGLDLSFQGFAQELDALPGDYAEPRGALLLALVDGEAAGCCALRAIDDVDYPNAAEMKRLFVRKAFRGFGLGRQLSEAILVAAEQRGYDCVLLDTLDDMESARALYEDLGFEAIPPYYHNPLPGAHYLKVDLR